MQVVQKQRTKQQSEIWILKVNLIAHKYCLDAIELVSYKSLNERDLLASFL